MARGAAARHPPTTQALAGHSLRDTAAQVHGMRAYRVCVRAAASCMFKSIAKLFKISQAAASLSREPELELNRNRACNG